MRDMSEQEQEIERIDLWDDDFIALLGELIENPNLKFMERIMHESASTEWRNGIGLSWTDGILPQFSVSI